MEVVNDKAMDATGAVKDEVYSAVDVPEHGTEDAYGRVVVRGISKGLRSETG